MANNAAAIMSEAVLYEAEGAVATVTLNRPEARNARTFEMHDGLAEICGSTAPNGAVRGQTFVKSDENFCDSSASCSSESHGSRMSRGERSPPEISVELRRAGAKVSNISGHRRNEFGLRAFKHRCRLHRRGA
jgi:hypothetical protein